VDEEKMKSVDFLVLESLLYVFLKPLTPLVG